MAEWVRDLFDGRERGCELLDGRTRQQFVRSAHQTLRAAPRDCHAAMRAWGNLLHAFRLRLESVTKQILRARVAVRGSQATFVDPDTHARLVYTGRRWLIHSLK
jgi:hypothetical protein